MELHRETGLQFLVIVAAICFRLRRLSAIETGSLGRVGHQCINIPKMLYSDAEYVVKGPLYEKMQRKLAFSLSNDISLL